MTPTLEGLLGIDPSSPDVLRAEQLATNDRALLTALVQIRKERGLSQAQVGKLMGISQPSVADFEAYDANPTLAKIRRYAHAVRALVVHKVEKDEGQLLDGERRTDWVATSFQSVPLASMSESTPQPMEVIQMNASRLRVRDVPPPRAGEFALAV